MNAEAVVAIRAAVRGAVQGVGFRWETVEEARRLGVMGWVRNDAGGEVRVHAEGREQAVEGLLAFLRRGPAGARVEDVDLERVKVEGHEQFAIRGQSAGQFTVAERAGGPRYALRLEVAGGLRAWLLPKQPSMNPADKRFAIEVEGGSSELDGDGDQAIWDQGHYEQGGRVAWPEALDRGHAVFVLHGAKLQGGFALQRTAPRKWLLIKRRE